MSNEEVRYLTAVERARLAALEEQQRKENSVDVSNPQVTRIVPASGKIYDITHADTDEHSVALPAGYPANTRALIIHARRAAGSGVFFALSGAGGKAVFASWQITQTNAGVWLRASDGLFYYYLTVANDDWDIYILGRIMGAP